MAEIGPAQGGVAAAAGRERILFATSNGTGLGHLTRSLAIARRLDPSFEPLVLTLSAAAPVVADVGFPVEYVASYDKPGAGSDWRWSRRLRGRLRTVLAELRPRVLVFDGAHPYQGMLDAFGAAPGMRTVWCRRPMWKPGSNLGALGRTPLFHAVLEPGELAEAEDHGPTVARRAEATRVAPIVFCRPGELLPRADAERELGLEPGRTNVLVALGQGAGVRDATHRCLRHLAGREGVRVAALSSAIAGLLDVPGDVVHVSSTYPMSRYYAAFDVAVSAAGYNAYHELLAFGVPSLFVPMPRETDDQAARARFAERAGVGRGLDGPGPGELERALDDLLDGDRRAAMRERLAALEIADGAAQAASWLEGFARAERRPRRRAPRWRRYLREPLRSAREAAPFVARIPVHAAGLVRQTIVRRPPRAVVVALGLEPGALEPRLAEALAGLPDPPGRVLVVTDLLEFGPLLRAGVGFEHLPARGSRQAELAGLDYGEFARSRLELILAERPRPRRGLAIGEVPAAVRAALPIP